MFRRISLVTILVLAGGEQLVAAPVTIVNPGFEDLYFGGNLPAHYNGDVPPTAFPVGNAPNGWDPYGAVGNGASIGVLNPGVMSEDPLATNYPEGAPEGDNVAIAFFNHYQGGAEFGIQQTLADALQPNTRYTLSLEVGNIASGQSSEPFYNNFGYFDIRGFPGYRVELLAGGQVIAMDDDALDPAEGTFLRAELAVDIGNAHPQLGQSLGIRLINLNMQDVDEEGVSLEVNFDDLRLDATPLTSADRDQDGDVDGDDLLLAQREAPIEIVSWQSGYGSSAATDSVATAVPEPRTALLLAAALVVRLGQKRSGVL